MRQNWQYIMAINPFIQEDEVESIEEISEWDLLITFSDGKKVMYDKHTGYHNEVFYDDVNELSEEQEKKEFAYRLRSLMGRRGIGQDELADMIGTSQTMISHYVSGRSIPSAIILRKIAKVLRCSMDDFFYRNY